MAAIVADLYEIQQKIGAGGGGIVFLGRHIRLNKKIVLKADKRKLSAGAEKLRNEVDLLKGLSHTYIPQVYDFVQENNVVYTVMDYVEGESLDKLLARGQKIPQRLIVKWACQLLEALSYLHKQKPYGILHGDIKPANIMLRPDGDICLIDFNIALALGEDGAVRVGYSRGYASPEHYGSDGSEVHSLTGTRNSALKSGSNTGSGIQQTEKVEAGSSTAGGRYTQAMRNQLLLDARSDIYSLGATLYHLLSGRKPAQKATEVVPLSGCCSPQICAIIQKAMHPEKSGRYQSAEEMLDAFLQLRIHDERVKKNKKRFLISAAVSIALFLLGGAGAFIGMKQTENYQTALTYASYSQASLDEGNIPKAVEQAMQALDTGEWIFKAPAPAQGRKALTDALGVYELSDGFKEGDLLTLPAAPFGLEVSPEGTRFAAVYAYEAAVYDIGRREPLVTCKVRESALSDCLFLDENTIVYTAEQGVEAYSISSGKVLWNAEEATNLAVSGDRSVIAAVSRDGDYAQLYRAADGKEIGVCSFGGRRISKAVNDVYADWENHIFALDTAGDWLAVSFADGELSVFDTKDPDNELILFEQSDYDVFSGGFCGNRFAFAAQQKGMNLFGVLDTEQAEMLGSMESKDKLMVQANADGICLSEGNLLAQFDADTLEQTELAYTEGNSIQAYDVNGRYAMVLTDDNGISFYDSGAKRISQIAYEDRNHFVKLADGCALAASRDEPSVRILRLEDHQEAQLFSYDAGDAHNEARVSADGKTLMLFDYEGFRTYDSSGSVIAKCSLPEAEQIYDQQYIREEGDSYLEVIWYDGTVRQYGVDGRLLYEEKREAPKRNLEEEFLTDEYRIVSKLHETPKVYSRKKDQYVGELEQDAELTYVTQLDGYIMTEYVNSEMVRYGILLDEHLQKVAYLPHLCDVYGNTVVFDYQNGDIRSSSIYTLDELTDLGRNREMNEE